MKRTFNLARRLLAAALCLMLVSGLALAAALNYKALLAMRRMEEIDAYAVSVEELRVPAESQVVALGEATHGSLEFQQLKMEILQNLVQNNGCRALAMELDFGEALAVDRYLQGGAGDGASLADSLSYPIYHTQQMADLFDWMRSYNLAAPEGETLHFYGFDMQNTAAGARYLLDFCHDNALPGLDKALQQVQLLTETESIQTEAAAAAVSEALASIGAALRQQDAPDTELALQAVQTLNQAMGSFSANAAPYADYRNTCMADNVEWILQREAARGGTVMLAAHNGHIARSWPDGSVPMGQLLAERLGQGYYAIGTDFFTAEVNIKTSSLVSDTYERGNHAFCSADPLAYQARYRLDGRYFLPFGKAEPGSALYETLHTALPMGSMGEGYLWLWYLFPGSSYRTEGCPAALYDGMVFFAHTAPTEVWQTPAEA